MNTLTLGIFYLVPNFILSKTLMSTNGIDATRGRCLAGLHCLLLGFIMMEKPSINEFLYAIIGKDEF